MRVLLCYFRFRSGWNDDIIQCFPNEEAYLYTKSGRIELQIPCGTMLVEDFNGDGWYDLVVEQRELITKDRSRFQIIKRTWRIRATKLLY